jgi:hypothetical protein
MRIAGSMQLLRSGTPRILARVPRVYSVVGGTGFEPVTPSV